MSIEEGVFGIILSIVFFLFSFSVFISRVIMEGGGIFLENVIYVINSFSFGSLFSVVNAVFFTAAGGMFGLYIIIIAFGFFSIFVNFAFNL